MEHALDGAALDAYIARLGIAPSPARPDLDTLCAIVWAHLTTIPFENLDVLLGEPIRLDVASVTAKLIARRRGGYCFEHNTLLAAALRALGYGVTTHAARVRWMTTGPTPRTHMLLAVDVPGAGRWLADVGFGGACPTAPMPLAPGAPVAMHHDRYRLVEDGAELRLQLEARDGGWSDVYAFTLEPQLPIDHEMANWFTSTYPQSRFLTGPMIAITTAEGRKTFRAGELVRRGTGGGRERIDDGDRFLAVLSEEFGLVFPPGTRFRGGPA